MAITDEDFNQFIEEFYKLDDRYPYSLKDKKRFKELSQNEAFIDENNRMYNQLSMMSAFVAANHETLDPSFLIDQLKLFEDFAEKWKTIPINSFLFYTPSDDGKDGEMMKEKMEYLFDEKLLQQTIKIYPWTTQAEVKQKFKEIRKVQPFFQLRPDRYAEYTTNFKIKALKDAKWKLTEILEYLRSDSETNEELYNNVIQREKELCDEGNTEAEIDKILNSEFPFGNDDNTPETDFNYWNVKKKEKAAEKLTESVWPLLNLED